jgi:hypothetical protein
LIPTGGWLENCGVLPMGAARADGSPAGWAAGGRCAQAAAAVGDAVGIAVGGLTRVVAAPGVTGRWKLEFAPDPAQPVNDPAARTNAAQAPTVRVVMRIPLLRADTARCGRPGRVPSPRAWPPRPALP